MGFQPYLYLLVLLSTSSLVHTKLNQTQRQKLDDFVTSLMACRHSVGVSLTMVKEGETVFADGFGYRDLDGMLPMGPDTRISVGSISKSFTATLAADVVGRGLATWDTPLKDILGEDFEMEGEFRTQEVSLRDLLAHKVGLPSYWGLSTAWMNVTREELVRRMAHFPVLDNFRSRFLYSNYLYVLAGWVTQVLVEKPWEQHIRDNLLDPLGMVDTKISAELRAPDWDNTAVSYIYDDDLQLFTANPEQDQLPFMTEIGPAGAVFASARDMTKWLNFHLQEGQNDAGDQLIPQSALRVTHSRAFAVSGESPRVVRPIFPIDDDRFAYALGWYNGVYRGMEKLYHTGSYSSYNCRMSLLPDVDVGVWACVNSPGDGRASTAVRLLNMFALDLLLDVEPWLNDTTACTFPDPWTSVQDCDTQPEKDGPVSNHVRSHKFHHLSDYVAVYSHPGFGDFNVFLNETDDTLYYTFGSFLSGRLNPSEDPFEFFMTLNPPISYRMHFYPQYPNGFPVEFGESENNVIESVAVPYLEFSLPPVFRRETESVRMDILSGTGSHSFDSVKVMIFTMLAAWMILP